MKTCIIMRGWPGSGKSTLASKIEVILDGPTCKLSADNYCINPITGKYEWTPEKVPLAHAYCRGVFVVALDSGSNIIVDNTNIKIKDYEFYKKHAEAYGYQVFQAIPNTSWMNNLDECFKRNVHSVPLDVIKRMMDGFEHDTGLRFYSFPGDTEAVYQPTTKSGGQAIHSYRDNRSGYL